jgi:hypothetical protein
MSDVSSKRDARIDLKRIGAKANEEALLFLKKRSKKTFGPEPRAGQNPGSGVITVFCAAFFKKAAT